MLRDFLHQNMQTDRTVDQYGDDCSIAQSSDDHLPVLQAELWAKTSSGHHPVKATPERLSQAQNLTADRVSKITRLLERR